MAVHTATRDNSDLCAMSPAQLQGEKRRLEQIFAAATTTNGMDRYLNAVRLSQVNAHLAQAHR